MRRHFPVLICDALHCPRRVFLRFWLLTLSLVAFVSVAAEPPLSVVASNYPLAFMAERIGGDEVRVSFPVPPDEDPAFWQPSPAVIGELQKADLILFNGADYERWLSRASLPRASQVNTSRAFRDRYIPVDASTTHNHGPSGAHAHTGTAFVTWLDMSQAIAQANAIKDAFVRVRPSAAAGYESGLAELEAELKALDEELAGALSEIGGGAMLASHPVYQYLARRYEVDLQSVMWEPGEDPGAEQWRGLDESLAERPADWMLWEDEPLESTRRQLREKGVGVIVFKPCANSPEAGDFIGVMRENLRNVRSAAGGGDR